MNDDENVSTFHSLSEACERILVLRFEKKHKRNIYCWIVWSMLCAWLNLLTNEVFLTILCSLAVTLLVRCHQCYLSTPSDELPGTAQRLWNSYILKVLS